MPKGQVSVSGDFPSFSEGLSLRGERRGTFVYTGREFPFLFGGTFIEGPEAEIRNKEYQISLPFRRDFH